VFFFETQHQQPNPETNPNWKVPSLSDPKGLRRFAIAIGINPDRFKSYPELQSYCIEAQKALNAAERHLKAGKDPH